MVVSKTNARLRRIIPVGADPWNLSQKLRWDSNRVTETAQIRLWVARTLHVRVAQRQEVRTSCAFGTWTYNVQATSDLADSGSCHDLAPQKNSETLSVRLPLDKGAHTGAPLPWVLLSVNALAHSDRTFGNGSTRHNGPFRIASVAHFRRPDKGQVGPVGKIPCLSLECGVLRP